ncbi:PEPxxWA-CTERM sorting domain-containing protein [Phenylobacterium sp.]|uniref:PEPxxWA-CTERM sorting domain-containing protein n=1 Tax=Phenylobacterium sp. TaxID=1871053 RepID=UPI0025D7EFFD|nr:PEPxxWA-CTERM sorting domain-containing protein [Phenylobacterium sp.]
MKFQRIFAGAALAGLAAGALAAQASAQTITNGAGTVSAGIGVNGELFDNATRVGLRRNADGYDPIIFGTPRDSWGVSTALDSAYADQNFVGAQNIVSTHILAGPDGATATSLTTFGLTVVQNYSFVGGGNILRIDTTVTNTTLDTVNAIFQRNVDFDIDPTVTNENVFGPSGGSGIVIDSSDFGFENPDPSVAYTFSCLGGCDATGDLGVGIKIRLGALTHGASSHFAYYYGINYAGDSVNTLIKQGKAAGAKYIIAGQSSDGNSDHAGSNSAFLGVTGVPEPATWSMMLMGFFGLGAVVRRKRALTA